MLRIQSQTDHGLSQRQEKPLSAKDLSNDQVVFWRKWLKHNQSFITLNKETKPSGEIRWQVIVLKKGVGPKIEAEGLMPLEWKDKNIAEQSARNIAEILNKRYIPYNQTVTVTKKGSDGRVHSFEFSLQMNISKHPIIGRIHATADIDNILS